MDEWHSGFSIDEAFHPWGTRFEAVAPRRVGRGYASVELSCRSACGFATVYAEPTAARPDRPVTVVAYELADTGAPSLSLYGAPRPSDFGDGLGKLYLSWTDTVEAAAPFLTEWNAANQAAAEAAVEAKPRLFSVRHPIYEADSPLHEPPEHALSMPELLRTPSPVAARLGPTSFTLWSDGASAHWYLSTGRSTIALGGPETSAVQVLDIAPAKDGGFSGVEVGPWSVRDACRSGSIAAAARALESVPGIEIERIDGHDA